MLEVRMNRRDFLAASAAALTLPLSKIGSAAAAGNERRFLYIAAPGIRNYVQYGGVGIATRDGLAQDSINRLFEDSRGDIWIASLIPGRDVLTRWDRASGRFQRYSAVDGLQAFNAPTSFYEDARHVLVVTLRDGGIARYDGTRFRIPEWSTALTALIAWKRTRRIG
jgi:hypothetical protein